MQYPTEYILSMRNLSQRKKYGLMAIKFVVILLIISLFSFEEEPSKLNTVVILSIVCVLATVIIRFAKLKGIIYSEGTWTIAILAKITITLFIVQYAWSSLGMHRDVSGFDPVRYDYYGAMIAEHSLNLSVIPKGLGYLGTIVYIGVIYWVFGISTAYVSLFNCLLSLIAFLTLTAFLVNITGQRKPWQLMWLGMFIPDVLYFDALPSKENLTMVLCVLNLYILYLIVFKKRRKYLTLAPLLFACLWWVRAHVAISMLALVGIWIIISDLSTKQKLLYIVSGAVVLVMFIPFWWKESFGEITGLASELNPMSRIKLSVLQAEPDSINRLLTPHSLPRFITYIPLRTLAYLVAPFPFWTIKWNAFLGDSVSYVIWHRNFNQLTVIFFLMSSPVLMAATMQRKCRRNPAYKFIVIGFWILLAVVANGEFMMHPRYRTMVAPMWMGAILIGRTQGNPKKYVPIVSMFILTGIILYYLIKVFL